MALGRRIGGDEADDAVHRFGEDREPQVGGDDEGDEAQRRAHREHVNKDGDEKGHCEHRAHDERVDAEGEGWGSAGKGLRKVDKRSLESSTRRI